jgi:hypothetical protein
MRGKLVAISLGDIIGSRGNLLVNNIQEVKRRFGLPQDSRVALIGTAADPLLENLWKSSNRNGIWERIAAVGFDWVTSLTYSVWDEMPRLDQIRNQYRNFETHDRFSSLGVPCIPFLFPSQRADYEALAEWLSERDDIDWVAMHAQSYKTPKKIRQLVNEMKGIQAIAKRQFRFMVIGPGAAPHIYAILSHYQGAIITWKPFHRGRVGEVCDRRRLTYTRVNVSREDAVQQNVQNYERFCHQATQNRWLAQTA